MSGVTRRLLTLFGVSLLAVLVAGCGGGGKKTAKPHQLTHVELVRQVSKSTVEVFGKEGSDEFGGTGIVLDPQKANILTAAHVVAGLASVKIRYKDTTTSAQVIGEAPCEDIAVLRVEDPPPGLRAMKLGSSANLHAGQTVTALGFPQSFQNPSEHEKLVSVDGTTSVDGTVDATPDPGLPEYTSVIQHQAPITHGDSGGPLVDRKGRLVGMNVLGNPSAETQNYAIGIDHIKRYLPQLEAGKFVAYLGWDLVPASELSQKDTNNLGWRYKSGGVGMAILGVETDSPAANHHFTGGDYFEDINGTQINSISDECDILNSNRGRIIEVKGYDLYKTGKPYYVKMRVR